MMSPRHIGLALSLLGTLGCSAAADPATAGSIDAAGADARFEDGSEEGDGGDRRSIDAAESPPDAAAIDVPWDAPSRPDPDSLLGAAIDNGLLVGAAVDHKALADDPTYRALLEAHFNAVTPENELKWSSLQPILNTWSFAGADAIVDFAEKRKMRIKGHALLWHEGLPEWLPKGIDAKALGGLIDDHIIKTVGRYKGRIAIWDVANEVFEANGTLRTSLLQKVLGKGWIAAAFHKAHEVDPAAKLFYNDFDILGFSPKSDAVYALCQQLLAAGVPLHGVGFQSHVRAATHPSTDEIRANIKRFADLGLTVELSELDVRVADLAGDHGDRMHAQRIAYNRVVVACAQEPGCKAVTTWGVTDKYSWVDDKLGPDDPLLFDEGGVPKPAFDGMRLGLLGAQIAATGPELLTNGGFEKGTTDWTVTGGILGVLDKGQQKGAAAGLCSGRSETWHGPARKLVAVLKPGAAYLFTAWAQAAKGTLRVTLRLDDGKKRWWTLAQAKAMSGQWVQLQAHLSLPATGALLSALLYVEGPPAGVDLLVDEASLRAFPQ